MRSNLERPLKMSFARGSSSFSGAAQSYVPRSADAQQRSHSQAQGAKFWQMHGVGLESAEGFIDTMSVGQVLAFEPILTVDGVGLYLEDMILVTQGGAEVLTRGLPYTSFEIEAAMRRG